MSAKMRIRFPVSKEKKEPARGGGGGVGYKKDPEGTRGTHSSNPLQ